MKRKFPGLTLAIFLVIAINIPIRIIISGAGHAGYVGQAFSALINQAYAALVSGPVEPVNRLSSLTFYI